MTGPRLLRASRAGAFPAAEMRAADLTPKRLPFWEAFCIGRAAALYAAVVPSLRSYVTWVISIHPKRFSITVVTTGNHVFTPQ